jgi:hypothetical protein
LSVFTFAECHKSKQVHFPSLFTCPRSHCSHPHLSLFSSLPLSLSEL